MWTQTYLNKKIEFDSPNPEDIATVDLVHHLGGINRWHGGLTTDISVLEHSIYVFAYVENKMKIKGMHNKLEGQKRILQALLHDAHEAYISDIPSPVKVFIKEKAGKDIIKILEENIDHAIGKRYGINLIDKYDIVKKADNIMLKSEFASFSNGKAIDNWINFKEKEEILHIKNSKRITRKEMEELFISKVNELSTIIKKAENNE